MTKSSMPTRVAADIAAFAASVAPAERRTVADQINYWARIGMNVERAGSLDLRRVMAVASGDAQFAVLSHRERAAAHAVIDARIGERVHKQRFGPDARAAGRTTVSLDDNGNLVEIGPDGTTRRWAAST